MPKVKKNHGRLKNIRCPQCGKKFYSETTILQHMNQPMDLCHTAKWYQDHSNVSHNLPQDKPTSSDVMGLDASHYTDTDAQPDANYPPQPPPSSPEVSIQNDEDLGYVEMDLDNMDIQPTFTETFPDCSRSYPGGTMFMDLFWQDEHTMERQENIYFPFALGEEWEFSSWCLRSGLSMTAIDFLLSLTIISHQNPCFEQCLTELRSSNFYFTFELPKTFVHV